MFTGAAKCWGNNAGGELGNNSTTNNSLVPVDVQGLDTGVQAISAGGLNTCAITLTGAATCWGYNSFGELGNNSTSNSPIPAQVQGLSSVRSISVMGHACAVTSAGAAKCWGLNAGGELGNGSTANSQVPVDVQGLSSGVQAIAVSGSHTCSLTTAGAVKCWGDNYYGELGNGSTANSQVPVDVQGLSSGVQAIAIGSSAHSCALTAAGGVKCWGNNASGQLGNNSTWNSSIPVDVAGLSSGVQAISVGTSHTCAVAIGGSAKCWGDNQYSELGNNSTQNSQVPADVQGLSSGVQAIAAGATHTCALSATGVVKCWGNNTSGQLGTNSTNNSYVPVDVQGL